MPQRIKKKSNPFLESLTQGLGLNISFEKDQPQLIVTFGKFDEMYCYLVAIYIESTKVHYILEEGQTRDSFGWGNKLVEIGKALTSTKFFYLGDDPLPPVMFSWLKLRINFTYNF